ncbi:MAG: PEGA domain-containing protein [Betaproteobacteria bacterium]|nr:PEGA domain-containing protein [Betaproteobacteria bacterium]
MAARGNRTVICTVVFIDIIEYSKKSVAEQMQVKETFNGLLSQTLADVPANDRIILDTGDGAAISFLGDPEEGLFLGLLLRDALSAKNGNEPADNALRLRIGINLGPVRLVKDINGQPNIIGDGINVAQRIMSFADTNQVLASRSFYEVVSALSPDYAHLFTFEGARTDKHVREHEVYLLGDDPAPVRAPRKTPGSATRHARAAMHKIDIAANTARAQLMRRPPLVTALTATLILVTAVALRLTLAAPEAEPPVETAAREPDVKKSPRTTPAVKAPAPVAETQSAPAPRARVESRPAPPPQARETTPAPVSTGTVRLQILPWGDVYVDGDKFGTAPPLRDVALKAGRHKIEIRNPGFASYVQIVDIRAGEEIRIRHRFQ